MAFLQEYTLLEELGQGGFATVYKVRHNKLGYIRAIRVLNDTIVSEDDDTYKKFFKECKILLSLGNGSHPNIVHIYQPLFRENKAFVEMDYVDGQDLLHYLKQNQNFIPTEEVIRMALQMSSALAYCHEDIYQFRMDKAADKLQDDPNDGSKVIITDQKRKELITKYKVIHNDIHSGNIMRRRDGNFVLLDFGLAINGNELVRSSRRKNGAPEFKSPEKWSDDTVLTEQSDIYSFGIVLYQYLAGSVPFPFNTNISEYKAEYELGEAHQKTPPPAIEPLRRSFYEKKFSGQTYEMDYPLWLEEVILKCLNKDPNKRFQNGKELFEVISAHVQANTHINFDLKVEQLNTENHNLETKLNAQIDANRKLNDQLSAKQNECNTLSRKLQEALNQIAQLQKPKKTFAKIILSILFVLLGAGISYLYLSQAQKNPSLNLIQIGNIDNLANELKQYKRQVSDLNAQIKEKQAQITQLQQQVAQPKNNGKSISQSDPDASSDQLKAMQSSIEQQQAEIESLKAQLKEKIAALEQANTKNAKLQREIEVLNANF